MWLVHQPWYGTFWSSKKSFPAYLYSVSLYLLFISKISDQPSLILAFLKFHTNEIIQYVVVCICFLSQSTNDPFSYCLYQELFPFQIKAYGSLQYVHPFNTGCMFGFFPFFFLLSWISLFDYVQVFVWICVFISLGQILRSEIAGFC